MKHAGSLAAAAVSALLAGSDAYADRAPVSECELDEDCGAGAVCVGGLTVICYSADEAALPWVQPRCCCLWRCLQAADVPASDAKSSHRFKRGAQSGKVSAMSKRPPFIISTADVREELGKYPGSEEGLSHGRAIGKAAGLLKIGLHVEQLEPGHRLSYPHAESLEEEFVFVLDGDVDAWVDGELHPMSKGDLAAFPAGTGICHTFINNGDASATLLVGGEASRRDNRIYYPLNPEREGQIAWSHWWSDIPLPDQGPHDGKPDRR